jgi:transcriptional regulator with XRE-family HTH domain
LARDNSDTLCSSCGRSSALKPPVVPRDFWNTAEMRRALSTWHMGRVIYAYRTHPWHPRELSQDVVGGWLGLTQPQMSRIEGGRAIEDLGRLIKFAQTLGIPRELLWFKLPGDEAANSDVTSGLTLPVIINGRPVLLPIDVEAARSQGLDVVLGQLADAGEVVSQLGSLPFPVLVPPQRNRTIQALAATDIAELERLAVALDDARRYLDGSVVSLFRQQLDRSKADDGRRGPSKVLPVVLGILGAISEHVREVKPDVRHQLLSLAADGAEFAGWLYRDLRDRPSAMYWYDRATEWAQAANDTGMQGYILLRKSQMAYEERDAHQVATFAAAAQHGPWQLPAMVRVEVCQQEARGFAMLGEPVAVIERKLGEAAQLFSTAGNDGEQLGSFDENALLLRSASCYIEAGRPARASELFSEALQAGGLSRRDEGYYRARRAFACALSGAPDDAAAEGMRAFSIAATTSSQRTTRELTRTLKVLEPWRSHPGPRQLHEALRTAR